MVLNPFFTQGTSSEQNLVQSLINEQLRMYGVDIYYIPRKYMTENTVIREVVQSKFDSALPIEAYVDNYDAYSGAGDVLSKFGIESKDEVRLIISRERYENYITPLIQGQANIKLSTRPKGGDLIWFPLDDRLYEIKDIEYAKPYYQLQNLYVYELYCELFRYQDEVIDTGIDDIDNELLGDETDGLTDDGINTIQGYTQTLTMVGNAVNATASISGLVSGGVRLFTITNRGGGYGSVPIVGVSSAPSGGVTAVGIASMIGGIIDLCDTSPDNLRVQQVTLADPGFGYTAIPRVTFHGGDGSGAYAIAQIADAAIGIVTVTSGGSGYIGIPNVTVVAPGIASTTIDAKITARLSGLGTISELIIEDAGGYFESVPEIRISGPQNTVGYGTYLTNEDVVGAASSATARVNSWNSVTKILKLKDIVGTFNTGEAIVGQASGAAYANIDLNKFNIPEDSYAQNNTIELEADSILDFSESNPFGST